MRSPGLDRHCAFFKMMSVRQKQRWRTLSVAPSENVQSNESKAVSISRQVKEVISFLVPSSWAIFERDSDDWRHWEDCWMRRLVEADSWSTQIFGVLDMFFWITGAWVKKNGTKKRIPSFQYRHKFLWGLTVHVFAWRLSLDTTTSLKVNTKFGAP